MDLQQAASDDAYPHDASDDVFEPGASALYASDADPTTPDSLPGLIPEETDAWIINDLLDSLMELELDPLAEGVLDEYTVVPNHPFENDHALLAPLRIAFITAAYERMQGTSDTGA
ncbi:hypothetical protein QFC20_007428 [Naganishia adeliensis]|uniref:Uncharacterized protein n=1 Tax=Naganishia adeliensis TaxID=92952 RepID=A0ACC2UZ71_9TREE|nr:hypothetical protein QFC20_007428 [Naganishia adeliensis]